MAVNPRKGIYELRIIRIRSIFSHPRDKGTASPRTIHKIKDNRNLYQEGWGYEVEGAESSRKRIEKDFSPKSFSFFTWK